MRSKTYILALNLSLIGLVGLGMSACMNRKKPNKGKGPSTDNEFRIAYYRVNPFANNTRLADVMKRSLSSIRTEQSVLLGTDENMLWAAAHCQCSPAFSGIYLDGLMKAQGALPQILVPSIREEIRNQPLLKTLLAVTPGSNFGASIASFFLKDSRINTEIRKGLNTKVNGSVSGGSTAVNDLELQFNLFPSGTENVGNSSAFAPKTVQLSSQASKWAHVLSLDSLWVAGKSPIGFKDHGLQMLATAATLSEWLYAFGLEKSADGASVGGLAFDPAIGMNAPLGAFDPRTSNGSGILSGSYSVSFPETKKIDQAINAREKWQRIPAPVLLDEQARIWLSAALAFERLRPSNRSVTQMYKASGGMLPDDAHLLPLSFLPGMGVLLDGGFIDTKALSIRDQARIPGDNSNLSGDRVASLQSLARLTRALTVWTINLENIERDQITEPTLSKIKSSLPKLKDALRLSVQMILDNYISTKLGTSKLRGIGMVESLTHPVKPSIEVAAEVLYALTEAELQVFKGLGQQTDYSKKLIGLHHWFAAEFLDDLISSQNSAQPPATAVFWTFAALQSLAKLPAEYTQAPWLNDAIINLNTAVSSWDLGFKR
jgi:hypothetical protein